MNSVEIVEVNPPSAVTLRRYGLNAQEWWMIWDKQGRVCPICKKVPSTGRTVIDHLHFKGFKKMTPEEKRKYVRGICCWFCNRYYLAKGINVEKAKNLATYLEDAEERKIKWEKEVTLKE